MCAALMALMAGCSLDPLSGRLTTAQPDEPTYQPVSPSADRLAGDERTVTLYFGFGDMGMLATESRIISVSPGTRLEQRVIEELISGPDAAHAQLRSLMPAGVRLMQLEGVDGVMMVTLSGEFLNAPADAPADWEGDAYWAQEVPRRRMLALQSIVCALTDLGRYDSVQLLIDFDGDGGRQGERVQRYYFYPGTARDAGVLLEAVRRDESAVLTARNAVGAALDCLQGKDWERLIQLIAPGDSEGERPSQEEAQARLQGLGYTLTGFEVGDAMVAGDGGSATVCVDVQLAYGDGDAREVNAFPLLLRRDAGAWKVTWSSLMGLLEGY